MEILAAFTIGLLGSIHCLGMCGPIALAVPLKENDLISRILSVLTYNTGRVFTYAVIGFIFGFIGKGFAMAGLQQSLSLASGILIILYVLFPSSFFNKSGTFGNYQKIIFKIKSGFGYLFQQKNYFSLFLIGLLNGLLPCGLIYMAAIGSVATGSIISGSLFMVFFGLGTVPAMLSVGILKSVITPGLRIKINKALPVMTVTLGLLLVVRGMNLGIPYLSPKTNIENCVTHCCH